MRKKSELMKACVMKIHADTTTPLAEQLNYLICLLNEIEPSRVDVFMLGGKVVVKDTTAYQSWKSGNGITVSLLDTSSSETELLRIQQEKERDIANSKAVANSIYQLLNTKVSGIYQAKSLIDSSITRLVTTISDNPHSREAFLTEINDNLGGVGTSFSEQVSGSNVVEIETSLKAVAAAYLQIKQTSEFNIIKRAIIAIETGGDPKNLTALKAQLSKVNTEYLSLAHQADYTRLLTAKAPTKTKKKVNNTHFYIGHKGHNFSLQAQTSALPSSGHGFDRIESISKIQYETLQTAIKNAPSKKDKILEDFIVSQIDSHRDLPDSIATDNPLSLEVKPLKPTSHLTHRRPLASKVTTPAAMTTEDFQVAMTSVTNSFSNRKEWGGGTDKDLNAYQQYYCHKHGLDVSTLDKQTVDRIKEKFEDKAKLSKLEVSTHAASTLKTSVRHKVNKRKLFDIDASFSDNVKMNFKSNNTEDFDLIAAGIIKTASKICKQQGMTKPFPLIIQENKQPERGLAIYLKALSKGFSPTLTKATIRAMAKSESVKIAEIFGPEVTVYGIMEKIEQHKQEMLVLLDMQETSKTATKKHSSTP